MGQESRLTVLCVVGARPNFMKIAPLIHAFRDSGGAIDAPLVHTGQHYDAAMKGAFFEQLGIPEPDVDLGVGSASHAVQTAEIMLRFEPVLDELQPDAVLVVGDVNSTIACALVAVKKSVPVVHVEAGLRSYDRDMPEEINRVLTDQISELLFITERSARDNLQREGVAVERVHFVGNVMIDTLRANLPRAVDPRETFAAEPMAEHLFEADRGYGLLTLHRPSNVDDPQVLAALLDTISELSRQIPLVFPLHPRTRGKIEAAGLMSRLQAADILLTEPLGYLQMLGVMSKARLVLTDSGGLQEESTALGIPCVTLRENTERPITVEQGTNTIVGTDPERIRLVVTDILQSGGKAGRIPELWDGRAAERIRDVLLTWRGCSSSVAAVG
ncbi:UDP-N-acetylglucosamine 2-epimerase (non-hydrolyzing) [Thiohalobacter sp. IOR34]|uniref:non-hydrolyzing UDP-N-acetylglucosamine 2-epimerase n=1 Tax=Thiohalobacter sp. IOR34 TaxID=3057176 RepID=UPI0025B13BFE|nr:UDP-N-acetylglucosamine 2-epimerase (non-hydrolyzing) [Thiohalobacter sp. IOR34]WJW74462.1 UDP-N-acetylglucosamine 2-epimerase (non-hydrolyzing) [Thiohalobacter sp. IOR34]